MRRVGHVTVCTDEVGQAAYFAAAHGVGLARERERPGTRLSNLPGSEVKINQGCVFGCPAARLVQTLAVQTQGCSRGGKHFRCRKQVCFFYAAGLTYDVGRVVANRGFQLIKATGVRRNPGVVSPAFPQHDMQHAVKQAYISAGLNRQIQIGNFGRVGAARVAKDDFHLRVGRFGVFNTPEKDRVCIRRVAADDENALGVIHVVVAVGRCISPQCLLVASHGTAHAQARVGVYVVGAYQALGQLVEDVIVFGQQLA